MVVVSVTKAITLHPVYADAIAVGRQIRCRKPGTCIYGWDIVTWPGYLTITGDLGHFVFRSQDDMLVDFFNGPINPQYWLEKCVAWDSPLRVVSAERVRYMADCDIAGHSTHALRALCAIRWTREQYLAQGGSS